MKEKERRRLEPGSLVPGHESCTCSVFCTEVRLLEEDLEISNWTWGFLKLIATSQAAYRSVNIVGDCIRQHAIVSLLSSGLGPTTLPSLPQLSNRGSATT